MIILQFCLLFSKLRFCCSTSPTQNSVIFKFSPTFDLGRERGHWIKSGQSNHCINICTMIVLRRAACGHGGPRHSCHPESICPRLPVLQSFFLELQIIFLFVGIFCTLCSSEHIIKWLPNKSRREVNFVMLCFSENILFLLSYFIVNLGVYSILFPLNF